MGCDPPSDAEALLIVRVDRDSAGLPAIGRGGAGTKRTVAAGLLPAFWGVAGVAGVFRRSPARAASLPAGRTTAAIDGTSRTAWLESAGGGAGASSARADEGLLGVGRHVDRDVVCRLAEGDACFLDGVFSGAANILAGSDREESFLLNAAMRSCKAWLRTEAAPTWSATGRTGDGGLASLALAAASPATSRHGGLELPDSFLPDVAIRSLGAWLRSATALALSATGRIGDGGLASPTLCHGGLASLAGFLSDAAIRLLGASLRAAAALAWSATGRTGDGGLTSLALAAASPATSRHGGLALSTGSDRAENFLLNVAIRSRKALLRAAASLARSAGARVGRRESASSRVSNTGGAFTCRSGIGTASTDPATSFVSVASTGGSTEKSTSLPARMSGNSRQVVG